MATPGKRISLAEINDLTMQVRDIKTQIETNERHLNMLRVRLAAIVDQLDPMKDALVVGDHEEEAEGL